jgi:ATP phosphoribosyltransferase
MVKLALPTGDLRAPVAELLSQAGLRVEGYGEGSRQYRLVMPSREAAGVRVFRERDIPIQVALGNYDIGITSTAWVVEIRARFPSQPIVHIADLGLSDGGLWAAAAPGVAQSPGDLGKLGLVRLASDYPNVAEAFARSARLPRYRVQGVAGAAAAYPPEDADVVIVSAANEDDIHEAGLVPLFRLLDNSVALIANASALAGKELSAVLAPLVAASSPSTNGDLRLPAPISGNGSARSATERRQRDVVRLAIPDGHQQPHVYAALQDARLAFEGYEEKTFVRRPASGIDGLEIKVIRPQDMAQLIAFGEFDLAIGGRDVLNEHLYQFPSSPAVEVIDLQRSQYNLSAVVDGDLPADTLEEAIAFWQAEGKASLTIASEFAATADHYSRSRHFSRYRVLPIAGASEGFVPEDAEMLIEGTETGRTIAENNLKIIDNIYRSTSCVIAHREAQLSGPRADTYRTLLERLGRAGQTHSV